MVFLTVVHWFGITHTDKPTHTTHRDQKTDTLAYKYILHLAISNCLYYTEWITCWYKSLLYRGPQCLYFLTITHL